MPISVVFSKVSFSYNRILPLFNDFDLVLPADKTIIITGRNGIGKSTLAMLAAKYLKPVSGIVSYIDDKTNLKKGNTGSCRVAYLSQNLVGNILGITPEMDLKLWGKSSNPKTERLYDVVKRALSQWNLQHKSDTPVWELSTGELKSLALACISMHPDRYWILDEPFVSLDHAQKTVLYEALKAKQLLSRGMLIITHEPDFIRDLADEIYVLDDNRHLERMT